MRELIVAEEGKLAQKESDRETDAKPHVPVMSTLESEAAKGEREV